MVQKKQKPSADSKRLAFLERKRRNQRDYRKRNKEKVSIRHRAYRRGIHESEIYKMLSEQHGLCLICEGELGDRFAVDHCHDFGNIRGLLCRLCNLLVGYAERGAGISESLKLLNNSIEFIKHHHGRTNTNDLPDMQAGGN